ncbi:CgeB family protein [Gelidibacter japonicus]|uniref:CgeB family protein n=1 Tax=Gelidibacter japonicus TaxID=1962232 RepID=UPI003A942840
MKILIPNYCLEDSFVDNVSFTLEQMGHEVIHIGTISVTKSYSKVYRALKDIQAKIFPQLSDQEKFILETIKTTKIDMMISLTQSLDESILYECKKKGVITVSWWGDTAANMTKRGLFTEYWDFVYIKDAYATQKLKSLGINAEQLLEAMNPAWHKPTHQQSNNELVIAGSFYDYRQFITKKLIEDKVELGLYGPPLPNWAYPEIKTLHKKKYITKQMKAEIFGRGLGVLNSTAMKEFDSVNCRAFEIAGCGGLHILENRKSIEDCFEPGKEVLTYDTYEGLLQILDRAKRFPDEMKKIRQAGAKRAHSDHTYEIRLKYILSKI